MPRLRALISSGIGGVLVFLVLGFWLRLPGFVAVTIAALLGVLFLMMAAAVDDDDEAADAAWRSASTDLPGHDARPIAHDRVVPLDSRAVPSTARPAEAGDSPEASSTPADPAGDSVPLGVPMALADQEAEP